LSGPDNRNNNNNNSLPPTKNSFLGETGEVQFLISAIAVVSAVEPKITGKLLKALLLRAIFLPVLCIYKFIPIF
jgi:hypothetical protein